MPVSYAEAVAIVRSVAQAKRDAEVKRQEDVQLLDALGRQASQDVRSPIDTPMADSSAMDGYAVSSELTADASIARPLYLRVEGTIAAGDTPICLPCDVDGKGRIPCVEVMTGSPFPQSSRGLEFDACIQWEHTRPLPSRSNDRRIVEIVKPPKPNQHRRLAGNDFRTGDIIVRKGGEIGPQHIMAGASVGIETVPVQKRLRASIVTTGCELQQAGAEDTTQRRTLDCNGPFLVAALHGLGLEIICDSGVSDNIKELQAHILKAALDTCDVLITTGGVSAGKFDFVPQAILNLGGSVHFHHVAIRPGHPVLFASLPSCRKGSLTREIAMFGLPGNPIAAAACYRFLVVPYIYALQGHPNEVPIWSAEVSKDDSKLPIHSGAGSMQDSGVVYQKDKALDTFRHAQIQRSGYGNKVIISSEQGPAKLRPFGHANCWVHIPVGVSEVRGGDALHCHRCQASLFECSRSMTISAES